MDDLDPRAAVLAEASDLIEWQGRVPAVDVADDVGARFEHHVLVDQAGARNRRTAGVDRGLDSVFSGPTDHLLGFVTRLDAAESDFAQ